VFRPVADVRRDGSTSGCLGDGGDEAVVVHAVNRRGMSSFGCAVFDPLIAIWFVLNAPTIQLPV